MAPGRAQNASAADNQQEFLTSMFNQNWISDAACNGEAVLCGADGELTLIVRSQNSHRVSSLVSSLIFSQESVRVGGDWIDSPADSSPLVGLHGCRK